MLRKKTLGIVNVSLFVPLGDPYNRWDGFMQNLIKESENTNYQKNE